MIAHSDAPWTPHFARFFRARGYSFKLVSFAPFPLDGADGVDTSFVGVEPYRPDANKHLFISRVPRVRQILQGFRPDVVFAPYLFSNGLTAVLSWNGPTVVAGVGCDVLGKIQGNPAKALVNSALIRFICRRAALVNTVSAQLTKALTALSVTSDKILELPFGVDSELFRRTAEPPRHTGTRLICVRKHESVYDIPTIIRALSRLRAEGRCFHCTFAGGGAHLERHRQMVVAAGLQSHVEFMGHVRYAAIPELLRSADVYISASLSDGTSVSLLEALATGITPVISSIPANQPWIQHGHSGLLFECGRDDQLAAAIARALDDNALRKRCHELNPRMVAARAERHRNLERLAEAMERLTPQTRVLCSQGSLANGGLANVAAA